LSLSKLKGKVEANGKLEQKTYDKFACWCEKTLARKAAAIDAGKETIDKTQAEIIELKGKLGELGATLKQLEKEIAENVESRREATEIREKENEDYQGEKTESEQCIGALESAIGVLTGAGTKTAELETEKEAELLSVVAGVRGVLHMVPTSHKVSDGDLQVVNNFVANPMQFVGAQTGSKVSRNPFGDYAPASTQIQGILKGMYDSFAADLEKANAEEADKQKAFEELFATKLAEHETLTVTLEKKTKESADATKQLADDKVLLEETKIQLEADEKFFEETKASCKSQAAEWADRSRLRTEELQGMMKAIEILDSDEARKTFSSAHNTFVQISAHTADQARNNAYSRLKTAVKQSGGSLRLAFLATEIRSGGHFDKVIGMIDKMIQDLRVEEQDDIKAKDRCQEEKNKAENEKEDLLYDIKKTGELIERLEAKHGELEKQIAVKQDEIDATNSTMAEMLQTRNSEVKEFRQALKDDADAVNLLGQAVQALSAFYTNNKLPLELAQKAPEFTVDEDKAPETFSKKHEGSKSESGGIIAILSMLKEDLEKEMKTSREEEAATQMEYEKMRGTLTETMNAALKTRTSLEKEKADLSEKIADANGENENKEQMKDDKDGEMEAMKPSCDWVLSTFDKRREHRKTEIQGLMDAKAMLAGAPVPEGFLQRN